MNKYIEVFCKQNPKISFPCSNPNCKKQFEFKTKEVFKHKIFKFKCNVCGKETEYDTSKFIKDFQSKMKKLGISVK